MEKAVLQDDRVLMRPLEERDAASILKYVGAPEIAAGTFVPHPYPPEAALEFVQKTQKGWQDKSQCTFAIIERESGEFAGAMGIHPQWEHQRAEVGYWIGIPFQGRGLATAALRLLIAFGFERLKLNRIAAGHFVGNDASGRVMRKAGMQREGTRRGYHLHRGKFVDSVWHAILREEHTEHRTRKQFIFATKYVP